jgi:hypothetical protein
MSHRNPRTKKGTKPIRKKQEKKVDGHVVDSLMVRTLRADRGTEHLKSRTENIMNENIPNGFIQIDNPDFPRLTPDQKAVVIGRIDWDPSFKPAVLLAPEKTEPVRDESVTCLDCQIWKERLDAAAELIVQLQKRDLPGAEIFGRFYCEIQLMNDTPTYKASANKDDLSFIAHGDTTENAYEKLSNMIDGARIYAQYLKTKWS